jgi:MFS family permease
MTNNTSQATTLHGILIILIAVMPVMAIVSLVPVLPLLEQEFSNVPGSEYLVPAALTIPAFCLAIFSPAAGWIADRVGRKNLLITTLVLYSGLGVLPFFLTDLKQIIAARFSLGIMEAALMTVGTTLVGDYFEGERRQRWLGIQVGAISVAAVVLVAIGGVLGQTLGSRGPFLMYLVALPLAILCQLFLYEPISKEKVSAQEKQVLPWSRMAPLVVGAFFFGILFYVIVVELGNIIALKTEPNPQFVGQMSALTNIAMICGTLLFGFLKSRLSGSALLTLGTFIIAAGYLVMAIAPSTVILVFGCAMVTFASGFIMPTFLTWLMAMLELTIRGRGTGWWQGAFFLGQFIAPIVAVALSSMLGGLEGAFYCMVILAVIFGIIAATRMKGAPPLAQQ